jgi:hypothetical protein
MRYIGRDKLFALALWVACVASDGCRRYQTLPMAQDTLQASSDSLGMKPPAKDSAQAKADTTQPSLPPMAKAIEPDRLQSFLPKMPGWTPQGEMQKEIQVRDNFNRSRVAQTFIMGTKKLKVQIDDFAYVPYLYDPWQKFKGTYLDDNNDERTETTTIAGYRAIQSMEKKEPHGEVTLFPGNRYVVSIVEDGADNINEVRRIAEQVDLKRLELLQ